MPKPFSNNATPKYLGYVYQVLIAIEQCFQAKKNETIWIECYGDVYDGNTSKEVKHHFGKTNLTSNSEDFWKTLKNLVTEDISEVNDFILHTTADIPDDSIFFGWNELSKTKKYDKLEDHTPVATIKSHYDAVIAKPKEELLLILEKLTIKSSQPNIEEKWQELKESRNPCLYSVKDNYKAAALHWIYGYIHGKAINDRYNWEIKINDFDSACKLALQPYTQNKIPFPHIEETKIDIDSKSFLFVEEMKNIELRKNSIEQAISDYFRSNETQINFLNYQPIIAEILDKYDSSILREMKLLKNEHSLDTEIEELNTKKALIAAKNLYSNCMKLPLNHIPQVNDTQKYYQDGRIHHNVNENRFVWRICEEDLL